MSSSAGTKERIKKTILCLSVDIESPLLPTSDDSVTYVNVLEERTFEHDQSCTLCLREAMERWTGVLEDVIYNYRPLQSKEQGLSSNTAGNEAQDDQHPPEPKKYKRRNDRHKPLADRIEKNQDGTCVRTVRGKFPCRSPMFLLALVVTVPTETDMSFFQYRLDRPLPLAVQSLNCKKRFKSIRPLIRFCSKLLENDGLIRRGRLTNREAVDSTMWQYFMKNEKHLPDLLLHFQLSDLYPAQYPRWHSSNVQDYIMTLGLEAHSCQQRCLEWDVAPWFRDSAGTEEAESDVKARLLEERIGTDIAKTSGIVVVPMASTIPTLRAFCDKIPAEADSRQTTCVLPNQASKYAVLRDQTDSRFYDLSEMVSALVSSRSALKARVIVPFLHLWTPRMLRILLGILDGQSLLILLVDPVMYDMATPGRWLIRHLLGFQHVRDCVSEQYCSDDSIESITVGHPCLSWILGGHSLHTKIDPPITSVTHGRGACSYTALSSVEPATHIHLDPRALETIPVFVTNITEEKPMLMRLLTRLPTGSPFSSPRIVCIEAGRHTPAVYTSVCLFVSQSTTVEAMLCAMSTCAPSSVLYVLFEDINAWERLKNERLSIPQMLSSECAEWDDVGIGH
eukprot:ANDGO_07431.mRNA.1 hypothetical protein